MNNQPNATQERCFTVFGKVPSPHGWVASWVTRTAVATDIEAIRRLRGGVEGMRVSRIDVGGRTIWRKP